MIAVISLCTSLQSSAIQDVVSAALLVQSQRKRSVFILISKGKFHLITVAKFNRTSVDAFPIEIRLYHSYLPDRPGPELPPEVLESAFPSLPAGSHKTSSDTYSRHMPESYCTPASLVSKGDFSRTSRIRPCALPERFFWIMKRTFCPGIPFLISTF